jgi:hypothetical protein
MPGHYIRGGSLKDDVYYCGLELKPVVSSFCAGCGVSETTSKGKVHKRISPKGRALCRLCWDGLSRVVSWMVTSKVQSLTPGQTSDTEALFKWVGCLCWLQYLLHFITDRPILSLDLIMSQLTLSSQFKWQL